MLVTPINKMLNIRINNDILPRNLLQQSANALTFPMVRLKTQQSRPRTGHPFIVLLGIIHFAQTEIRLWRIGIYAYKRSVLCNSRLEAIDALVGTAKIVVCL